MKRGRLGDEGTSSFPSQLLGCCIQALPHSCQYDCHVGQLLFWYSLTRICCCQQEGLKGCLGTLFAGPWEIWPVSILRHHLFMMERFQLLKNNYYHEVSVIFANYRGRLGLTICCEDFSLHGTLPKLCKTFTGVKAKSSAMLQERPC